MLNNYVVTMESKDNKIFTYNTIATSRREAGLAANKAINEKGWGDYQYVIIKIEFLTNPEEPMNVSAKSDVVSILKGVDSE